jgi:broad specificity phosphatase PhoE
MHELVLARHGESEASARGLVGGDTPLTARGRAQATELGRRVADFPADVCLTSAARRARETAELALDGRPVPIEMVPALGDIRFGVFEGGPLAEYRSWIEAHDPGETPTGGESRVQTLSRFAHAFREIASRPEDSLLVVAHGLTLRALLDERPQPVVAGAAFGEPVRLTRFELERALDRLERWCESPSW